MNDKDLLYFSKIKIFYIFYIIIFENLKEILLSTLFIYFFFRISWAGKQMVVVDPQETGKEIYKRKEDCCFLSDG
jgi:hypothetical protein